MMKVHYRQNVGLTPRIIIEQVQGDLTIKGWMRSDVYIATETETVPIQEQGNQIQLSCPGDCVLRVPRAAQIEINQALGNVQLKYLDGAIAIQTISESLAARTVARLAIQTVHGDVLLKGILEDVSIAKINGDLILRDLQGGGNFTEVNGSFDARAVSGALTANVNDDARLEIESLAPKGIQLKVAGDLRCDMVSTLDVSINLSSAEEDILVRSDGERRHLTERTYQSQLGKGTVPFNIECEGKIILFIHSPSWHSTPDFKDLFGAENDRMNDQYEAKFTEQIEAQVESFNQQMQHLSDEIEKMGVSQPILEKILERARVSSQKASIRAQEKMRLAQEKLAQRMTEARVKADTTESKSTESDKKAKERETGSSTGVKSENLEDERLYILKMLEEKKITVEQAERLLSALGDEG